MNHTVIGIFDSEQDANQAVEQLVHNGLPHKNIDYCSKNTFNKDNGSHSHKAEGFFGSLFDKDEDVRNHSQVASRGCMLTVHASSSQQAQLAADVMDRFGAVDVEERAMQYRGNTSMGQTRGSAVADSENAIPIIEEELQVGKQVIQTGGVRLRSRIIERAVEEHLRLREEHVTIERNPVDRPTSTASIDTFQEGVIELIEKAEVPIVAKEARVVEEVSLSKQVTEHEEVIRDSVRHTEVDVEDLSGQTDLDKRATSNNLNRGTSSIDTDSDATFLDKSHQNWSSALQRMREVENDYKIASDDPDVRGWEVVDAANTKIGEVSELIVDTNAMKVRYLEVDVDRSLMNRATADDHHILIPIGSATLDRTSRNVMVSTLTTSSLASYPAYSGEAITRDYEHGLISALSPGHNKSGVNNERFYEGEHFDSGRFFGSRNL
jgi:uncharacterized protein (TIGR02271 family)